jgi:hypothetical protein
METIIHLRENLYLVLYYILDHFLDSSVKYATELPYSEVALRP